MTARIGSLVLVLVGVAPGCSGEPARPPYVLEGTSAGSPCERAGFRCVPGNLICADGTVSAGKSLGCPGEGASCCMNAPDASVRDATAEIDAPAEPDANPDARDGASD